MRKDLMFDHDDERAIWQVTGATIGFFLLIHKGIITFKDLSNVFGQSEASFCSLYKNWLKYNNPNDPDQLEFDLIIKE